MNEPGRAPIEALLDHAAWARRLAQSLVGRERAEDLTQDAWVAALKRPPAAGAGLRGWLGRVLVNRARETRRSEGRLVQRERRAARPERVDDPVERLAAHRELTETVEGLPEPWRRAVLLRYFDDLPLKEVAAREGVPVSTVNTRLRKARELLRERLDDRHGGDREAWMAALLPLARGLEPLATVSSAAIPGIGAPLFFMKTPLVLSAVAALLVAAVFVLPEREVLPAEPVRAPEQPVLESAGAAAPPALAPVVEKGTRAVVAETDVASAPATAPVEAVAPPPTELVGQVIDTRGGAMPGLEVWLEPGDEEEARLLATSAADGTFPVDPARDLGKLAVRDAHWGTALSYRLPRGARRAPILVVAPRIRIAGVVRNEEGQPVERARVATSGPRELRTQIAAVMDNAQSHEPGGRTDEEGAFDFEDALAVEGSELHVEAQGYEALTIDLPLVSTSALEIVLRLPDASKDALLGQVVDAMGRGVPDAWVALGHKSTRTDESGGFRVETDEEGQYPRLVAAKEGFQPGIVERPRDADGELASWPGFVLLQLGDPPRSLSGRVLDEHGEPRAGLRVWLADGTYFGRIEEYGVMVEGMMQGLLDQHDHDVSNASWPWAVTDAGGRFELAGLLDRDYDLKVFDDATLLLSQVGPFEAGRSDLEIVLGTTDGLGVVAGRVVAPDGEPLPGVEIEPAVSTYSILSSEWTSYGWSEEGEAVLTDEEGRFRFQALPRERTVLYAKHPDIIPQQFQLKETDAGAPVGAADWDSIEMVCERRYHLKVEVDPELLTEGYLRVYDGAGEEVFIQVFSANGSMSTHKYSLAGGKSEVLSLPGRAHELVLLDAEQEEVERRELSLTFGEVNVLRLR